MREAARHASDVERHASHGASLARHKAIIRTTEINRNNFIFNFQLGNLDFDLEIRISELQ